MDKTTLDPILHPLMDVPDIVPGYCAICGRRYPLEKHHIVPRSAGELYRDGKRLRKPVIQLCGFGNNLKDANGRYYCHGLVHNRMLHFKAEGGHPMYALFDEPTDYMDALVLGEWRPL